MCLSLKSSRFFMQQAPPDQPLNSIASEVFLSLPKLFADPWSLGAILVALPSHPLRLEVGVNCALSGILSQFTETGPGPRRSEPSLEVFGDDGRAIHEKIPRQNGLYLIE
jgi:hypothetical protein